MTACHPAPFGDISTHVDDPKSFVDELYRKLLDARPHFPGDTNYTGACIDCVLERLESSGAKRSFDKD